MKFHFNTKDTCGHCRDLPGFDTADVLNWDQRGGRRGPLNHQAYCITTLPASKVGREYLFRHHLFTSPQCIKYPTRELAGGEGLFEAEGLEQLE